VKRTIHHELWCVSRTLQKITTTIGSQYGYSNGYSAGFSAGVAGFSSFGFAPFSLGLAAASSTFFF